MKDFIKMTLATLTGLCIFIVGTTIISVIILAGALAIISTDTPTMPDKCILKVDMSTVILTEQSRETDPFTSLQGGQIISQLGVFDATRAIEAAAYDPAIKYLYLKPDAVTGGPAQIEEFRRAIANFRAKGKAVISYIENPTNGGMYLASAGDKIYMTPYSGGINMFNGMSSQLIFLKDILDKLEVRIQLIRHGKYKSAGEMFIRNSSSKENLEQNRQMIASMWESWAEAIASARGISVDGLNRMLDNLELNSPEDFLEKGLVDQLLTREDLKSQLTDLYVAERFEQVKAISIQDYSKIKASQATVSKDKIAIIYIDGNIMDGDMKQQVSGDRFAEIIAEIRKDTSVKAAILRVNSPGGSVLAAEKIKEEVDRLGERIPVIASFSNYAASGGYWISAAADYIYADACSLTGSIGVFSLIPDFGNTLKNKLNINVTTVKSNAHADMYTLLRPLDGKEIEAMQDNIEDVYDRFLQVVAEGRDMSKEDVDALGQGRIWTGREATENQLVDQIGGLHDALMHACLELADSSGMSKVEIVEYPKPQTGLELFLESFKGTQNIFSGTPVENVEKAFCNFDASRSGQIYARMPYEIIIR